MKMSFPCEQESRETGNLLDSPIKSGNDRLCIDIPCGKPQGI